VSSSLRVVHVMEATIGGTRRHLRDVARLQREQGLDVTVVAAAEREPAVRADLEQLAALGVRVRELAMRRAISPWEDARHLRTLTRWLRELAPEVVHTHSSKAGVLGRLASLHARRGVRVHTPHTFAFLFEAMFSVSKRRLFRAVERHLAARTHALVAVSQGEAETMRASGIVDPARVRVVPNGIDPAPWLAAQPLARAAFDLPAEAPWAAVVGLLNVAKGQDLALEALARPECGALCLLIVGEGEQRAALAAQAAALGVAARVRFLGWREDVPALLATCDLLLLPSRWEGLPYIVLEACAAGLPVVATPVDGARELVVEGRTGALAEAGEPAALARALARVLALAPAERRALGAAGRAQVLAQHSAARMAERLLAVYREFA